MCDIAYELGVHSKTVSWAPRPGGAPRGIRRKRGSKLDSFREVVDRLLSEGVWNSNVILREIQVLGIMAGRRGPLPRRLMPFAHPADGSMIMTSMTVFHSPIRLGPSVWQEPRLFQRSADSLGSDHEDLGVGGTGPYDRRFLR